MKKNLLILVTAICSFNCFAQLPSWLPSNGLRAWYPFSGNANDSSGNNFNGTPKNGVLLTSDRFGNANSAYYFDGINDYIELNGITPSQSFSISVWFLSQLTTSSGKLLGWDGSLSLDVSANGQIFGNTKAGLNCNSLWPSAFPSKSLAPSNQWTHVVWTKVSGNEQIYLNGILDTNAIKNSGSISNCYNKLIGVFNNGLSGQFSSYFKGKIDDVAIWNRILDSSEVKQLYLACYTPLTSASISSYGIATFCAGSDVMLTANPNKYVAFQWKKNNSNITSAKSSTYIANATGNYKCVVNNACGTVNSNTITLTKLPLASVTISNSGSLNICPDSSVTLTATDPGVGYTYQWVRNNISIPGATGLSYTAYNAGSYKIQIANTANGCIRHSNTKKVVVVSCRNGNVQLSQDLTQSNINVYPNPVLNSFTFELNEDVKGTATISLLNTLGQTVFENKSEVDNGQPIENIFINDKLKAGLYILRIEVGDKMFVSKVIIN